MYRLCRRNRKKLLWLTLPRRMGNDGLSVETITVSYGGGVWANGRPKLALRDVQETAGAGAMLSSVPTWRSNGLSKRRLVDSRRPLRSPWATNHGTKLSIGRRDRMMSAAMISDKSL